MTFFVKSMSTVHCLRSISASRCTTFISARNLYSAESLGIDRYLSERNRTKREIEGRLENFKTKMAEFANSETGITFTEDLKNMLFVAEQADIDVVQKMIQKFNERSKPSDRFGSFIFGPVVMRMFHFLDAPNEALKCYEDDQTGFFDQLVSHQLLLDLLLKHGKYDAMYGVFDRLKAKQLNMTKYPKYCVVLIFAACYKQNTPQSLKYASDLWSAMVNDGAPVLRRASVLIAALALKQCDPDLAMKVMSTQRHTTYITVRNIMVMALSDLGRLNEVMPILKRVLENTNSEHKHTFYEEAISKIREAVDLSDDPNIKEEFLRIESNLRQGQHITNDTLDQRLFLEITVNKTINRFSGHSAPYRSQVMRR